MRSISYQVENKDYCLSSRTKGSFLIKRIKIDIPYQKEYKIDIHDRYSLSKKKTEDYSLTIMKRGL